MKAKRRKITVKKVRTDNDEFREELIQMFRGEDVCVVCKKLAGVRVRDDEWDGIWYDDRVKTLLSIGRRSSNPSTRGEEVLVQVVTKLLNKTLDESKIQQEAFNNLLLKYFKDEPERENVHYSVPRSVALDEMIRRVCERFTRNSDYEKRLLEVGNIECYGQLNPCQTFFDVEVHRDVLVRIFGFIKYDVDLLVRIGCVSKCLYLSIISSWKNITITKMNIYQISVLVLRSVRAVSLDFRTLLEVGREGLRYNKIVPLPTDTELSYLSSIFDPYRVRVLEFTSTSRFLNQFLRREDYKEIFQNLTTFKFNNRDIRHEQREAFGRLINQESMNSTWRKRTIIGSTTKPVNFKEFLPRIQILHFPSSLECILGMKSLRELSVKFHEIIQKDSKCEPTKFRDLKSKITKLSVYLPTFDENVILYAEEQQIDFSRIINFLEGFENLEDLNFVRFEEEVDVGEFKDKLRRKMDPRESRHINTRLINPGTDKTFIDTIRKRYFETNKVQGGIRALRFEKVIFRLDDFIYFLSNPLQNIEDIELWVNFEPFGYSDNKLMIMYNWLPSLFSVYKRGKIVTKWEYSGLVYYFVLTFKKGGTQKFRVDFEVDRKEGRTRSWIRRKEIKRRRAEKKKKGEESYYKKLISFVDRLFLVIVEEKLKKTHVLGKRRYMRVFDACPRRRKEEGFDLFVHVEKKLNEFYGSV